MQCGYNNPDHELNLDLLHTGIPKYMLSIVLLFQNKHLILHLNNLLIEVQFPLMDDF